MKRRAPPLLSSTRAVPPSPPASAAPPSPSGGSGGHQVPPCTPGPRGGGPAQRRRGATERQGPLFQLRGRGDQGPARRAPDVDAGLGAQAELEAAGTKAEQSRRAVAAAEPGCVPCPLSMSIAGSRPTSARPRGPTRSASCSTACAPPRRERARRREQRWRRRRSMVAAEGGHGRWARWARDGLDGLLF